jgi:1,4-alpha-glucan branching enzyme
VVAPFDTELFGHWWFEGPDFLGDVYATLPRSPHLRATTASEHLDAYGPAKGLRLAAGSWGRDGDYSMWLNDQVLWTWPIIWEIEDAFWDLAPRALELPATHEVLAQAARELLLLQASDWQFIISTGEVDDYAIRRFNGHAGDTRQLLDVLRDGVAGRDVARGVDLARDMLHRDNVFHDILPSIRDALEGQRRVKKPGRRRGRERGVEDPAPAFESTSIADV